MSTKTTIVAIMGGLLLGLGTVFFALWPLSLVSFACIMYVLHRTHNFHERFLALWILGAVGYACSFYGLYFETLPLDWLGLPTVTAVGLLFSAWFLSIVAFAIGFAFFFSVAKRFLLGDWRDSFFIAAVYVWVDIVGMFVYSLVFFGTSATAGPHFSVGSPGYQLAESPFLLQAASLGGLPALLFIQAFIGCFLYVLYTHTTKYTYKVIVRVAVVAILVMVATAELPFGGRSSDTKVTVAVASLYEAKHDDTFRAKVQSIISSLPTDIDIISLPEDSRFIQYLTVEESTYLQEQFADAYILDSGTIPTREGLIPEIEYYSTREASYAMSSKEFLMVFGEYVPYLYIFIAHLIGQGDVITMLKENHGYVTKSPNLFFYQGMGMTVKLCSDGISPWLYGKDVRAGATVMFNLASHGWFHRSELLYELAKRVGKVRAVESGRWYLRPAYETPALAINDRGAVVAETRWLDDTTLIVDVPILEHRTLFVRMGELVLLFPLSIILYYVYRKYRARIIARM